ncbi:uncharacterized protein LOC121630031 [Melanotaenia boesemani]|uniref:uncharacterized protein LOC121630031 n=1 Tax=Melanotaenia boesemani TaxID=1250792 RepID=UPI001C04334A|nr:uncharacterized protein LOC121630031 [Melanotaenia boesemani]
MFAVETKSILKNLGADKHLISNHDLSNKVELLTLVKVREGSFWQFPKYKAMLCSLPEFLDEKEFQPGFEEEVLGKDFMTSVETSGSGSIGGGDDLVGKGKISAGADTVDTMTAPVSLKKKKANLKNIRSKFSSRTINKDMLKQLNLKETDKLTFVNQTVYNTGPVKLIRKSNKEGSISALCQKMVNLLVKGSAKEETSFTVLEESTFAYGLTEILYQDEKLEISYEPRTNKQSPLAMFKHDSGDSEILQQVQEGIQMKEALLQPLADLPESSRPDVLKALRAVLEDRDDLTLLEETLEQCSRGSYNRPQSSAVASFMDLLDAASSAMKDAFYLLVSAMDTLPDGMPPRLMSCSPETLSVLSQLVDGLKQDGQAQLPESLPAPLQEDGEFR